MKKLFLMAVIGLVLFSCSKSKSDNNSTATKFQFQLNGKLYTFDSVYTYVDSGGNAYSFRIEGWDKKTLSNVSIQGQSYDTPPPGDYINTSVVTNGKFLDGFIVTIVSEGKSTYYVVSDDNEFTLTIDAFSNGTLKGHFSGQTSTDVSGVEATVEKGEFQAPYHF